MNVLSYATHVAAALSLVATVLAFRGQTTWLRRTSTAAAVTAGVSFLFLASRFLAADVQYTYVFLYTRADLDWWYRLAGTWAGREGSLLLWALWLSVIAAFYTRHEGRLFRGFLGLAATAFLAASAWQTPYAPTPGFFLEGRPGGNGLNPTLLNPFILIHPPMMFLAYAMTTIPAASSFASMLGGGSWSLHRQATRLNTLLYTAAMGLGGVWAYYTLGFGGYWAWDPVEVANLLPWLALVVYIHAERHHHRHGRYAVAGPFLAILPLVLTVLSTVSTRSGLWVSVHAFTDPSNTFNPDPAARFLDILAAEPGLIFHVGVLLFVFFAGLAAWCRHLAHTYGTLPRASRAIAAVLGAMAGASAVAPALVLGLAFEVASLISVGYGLLVLVAAAGLLAAAPGLVHESPGPDMKRFGIPALVYAAVVILGLGLAVLFLFHMASVLGWSEQFYVERLPWIATPAILAITLFMAKPWMKRKAPRLVGIVFAAALLAALVDGRAYLLVLAGAATLVAAERVRLAISCHTGTPRIGDGLMLLAAFLNVLFWLSPPALIWRPIWPAQFFLGSLAVLVLVGAMLRASGRIVGPRWLVPAANAALVGFFVAPVLVLLALRLEGPPRPQTRLKHASIAGIHAAVLLIITGMAAQAFAVEAEGEVQLGQRLEAGDWGLTYTGSTTVGQVFADEVRPAFTVERTRELGSVESLLYWEPQTASHYPLPATLRTWNADAYWNVNAVCVGTIESCEWVNVFQSGPRIRADAEVAKVDVRFEVIPGVGLVWTGVTLLVVFLGLLILAEPTNPRTSSRAPRAPLPP